MADLGGYYIPAPRDWQAFERDCRRIYAVLWGFPATQLNGRGGQAQHGVDVFGKRHPSPRWSGVQCKGKDGRYGQKVSAKELLDEIEKAKSFTPPLEAWILATTAQPDTEIQALARQINDEHEQQGLFTVTVLSWDEIVSLAGEHPELVKWLCPALAPPEQVALTDETLLTVKKMIAEAIGQGASQIQVQATLPQGGPAHAGLDLARTLLNASDYKAARPLLEDIRHREWDSAPAAIRFRIATNLGALHWGLGDARAAGEYFLEAFEYDQNSEKALTNRATGLMLLDRPQEALEAARQAVVQHPARALPLAALINIQSRVEPAAALPAIPAALADDPQLLFAQGDALLMRERWAEAETCWRSLVNQPEPPPLSYSRLAEVLMAQASGGGRFYVGAHYSPPDRAALEEARALLLRSWTAIKSTGLAQTNMHVVQNYSAVSAVLGDLRDAEPTIDEALSIAPGHPGLLSRKLNLQVARGDGNGALNTLSRVSAEGRKALPEYDFLHAMALRAAGQMAQSLEVLERFINVGGEPELINDARCLFADLLCEADLEHAEDRFNALPDANSPAVARSTLIFARSFRDAVGDERARQYLDLARTQIDAQASTRDRLMLADALSDFNEEAEAIAIYEKTVSLAADSGSLREYLRCLFNLEQRKRLGETLNEIPDAIRAKPWYQWFQGNFAHRIGELKQARAHYEKCFDTDPTRFNARLRWAEVCIQVDDRPAVEKWLAGEDILNRERTLSELLWTARLLNEVGRKDDAIDVGYTALRRFPRESKAHMAFAGALMLREDSKWLLGPDAQVQVGMACELRDASGVVSQFIIEDKPDAELAVDELSARSSLAQKLLGKRVNDVVVTFDDGIIKHESTLIWIKHKYVHALHESINNFNTRFPEARGFIRAEMPTQGTAEERFAPILKMLENQQGRTQHILSLYRTSGMPLAMVGKALGRSVIQTWQIMIGHYREPIAACFGTHDERRDVSAILDATHRYIIEPLALYQLHVMSRLDLVAQTCGRLAVVQSTIDEIREELERPGRSADGHSSLILMDGKPVRHDVGPDDVAFERARLESLLAWIAVNCDVVPAVPKQDRTPESSERLTEALGHATYDTLLAANGAGLVLLSDDWNLRRLARGEFEIPGVWIQAILLKALALKLIDDGTYARSIADLADWGHRHLAVRPDDLILATDFSDLLSREFVALASTLNASRVDRRALINAVVTILAHIWRGPAADSQSRENELTVALLRGVDPGASNWSTEFYRALKWSTAAELLPRRAFAAFDRWYREQGLSMPVESKPEESGEQS